LQNLYRKEKFMSEQTEQYFDAHAHLQMMPDYRAALEKARQAGVSHIICNATHEGDWKTVLQIARENEGVYAALGVHPHYMDTLTQGWEGRLEKLLAENPNVMVGEIGMDKMKPDLDLQEAVFSTQLTIAHTYGRPAIVHCVRCWDRLLHTYKTQRGKMPPKVLSHSHHGNADLIPELAENYNMYFSYSSIFVPDNHPKVQACLKATPLDRLLIESDCPDLAPEPASVVDLVQKMSVISGHKEALLKKVLFENAKAFVRNG